jgi:cellulose synthase (UDP-forming)
LFGQLWYFLFSAVMLAAFGLPPLALALGYSFANVLYFEFLFISIWPSIIALITVVWLKRQGLLRPVNAKVFSWEGVCFELARWPWVVWAVIDAFRITISKSHVTWRITPKDGKSRTATPIRFLIPYLLIILFCGVAAVVSEPNPDTRGYFWFTLFNAICYLVLLTVILYSNARESITTESVASP